MNPAPATAVITVATSVMYAMLTCQLSCFSRLFLLCGCVTVPIMYIKFILLPISVGKCIDCSTVVITLVQDVALYAAVTKSALSVLRGDVTKSAPSVSKG